MARTSQNVKVGKRTIELSNLKKVLFPDDHIVKAELIEYYLKLAPTILRHIKGRALSFVRKSLVLGREDSGHAFQAIVFAKSFGQHLVES